jgi:hypothetical protein
MKGFTLVELAGLFLFHILACDYDAGFEQGKRIGKANHLRFPHAEYDVYDHSLCSDLRRLLSNREWLQVE